MQLGLENDDDTMLIMPYRDTLLKKTNNLTKENIETVKEFLQCSTTFVFALCFFFSCKKNEMTILVHHETFFEHCDIHSYIISFSWSS